MDSWQTSSHDSHECMYCIWGTLMKGKFDKFDVSWSHHQTKTIQYYVSNISTSIIQIYGTKHTHKINM